MTTYSHFKLTQAGTSYLLGRAVGDQPPEELALTRIGCGAGNASSYSARSTLMDERQSFPILSAPTVASGQATVRFLISSEGLAQTYFLSEIGLFAEVDGNEILYAWAVPDNPNYPAPVPAEVQGNVFEQLFELAVAIGDAEVVVVNFDGSLLLATQEDLAQLRADMEAEDSAIRIAIQQVENASLRGLILNATQMTDGLLGLHDAIRAEHGAYPET